MTTYETSTLVLQAIAGTAIVATFVVYYYQLRSMQHGVTCQNLLTVITFLQSQEHRDARAHIIKNLKSKSYNDWNDDDKRYASTVCATYDTASIMVTKHLIDKSLFIETYGPSFRMCFQIVTPFLEDMRAKSGPDYWGYFYRLGGETNNAEQNA